jgi:uracil phosphoribosyltransferase
MLIEQTSNFIKMPNRIMQGLVNAVVSAVKINPQEIATPNAVARSNHVDKRKQVQ